MLATLTYVAGCASSSSGARNDAVDARVDAASRQYATGIELMRRGEVEAARQALSESTASLAAAAADCRRQKDCDTARVDAAYDGILRTRNAAATADGAKLEQLIEPLQTTEAGDSPVVTALPAATRSVNLLNGRALRDVIAVNEPMRHAMTEWLTWMRPQLLTAYENYEYMRHQMWPAYERAGLPEALLFGILAKESAGRVHAVSRAGAAGPLQFMPATGQRFGLGRDGVGFDSRYDPGASARANVQYLNERFAELGNNLELALAAYNGGEGRIGRIARENPGASFWEPRVYAQIPAETRDYVPMVLAAAWLFLHPQDYGLDFPQIDAKPATIKLERAASINALAICLGQGPTRDGWFRALRNLNPRYEAHQMLAVGTSLNVPQPVASVYSSRCVQGPLGATALQLAAASRPVVTSAAPTPAAKPAPSAKSAAPSAAATYTVKRGDSLAAIARKQGCRVDALAKANRLKAPYPIRPGQQLSLAGCKR